jgi:tRNA(fMet)-specific endonuclease VapC
MDPTLLDTDMLSEVLKQRNVAVTAKAATYLQQHGQFTISAFSRFEIRRGFFAKQASKQLARFETFCNHSVLLPITDAIFDRAAILWADAQSGGHPCGDADLLIAATAMTHDLVLATGNLRHFAWISGLKTKDWRTP